MTTATTDNQNIDVHEKIIAKITESIPVDKNKVKYISSILDISSKSAYRRLAGTTKFSLEEASIIASNLGFSLDSLIGHLPKQNALFELDDVEDARADICKTKMEQYMQIFGNDEDISETEYMLATNGLPIGICVKSSTIYKFTLYKWLYWTGRIKPTVGFDQIKLTEDLIEIQQQYNQAYSSCRRGTLIFDEFLYHSIVAEVEFFYARGLLSETEKSDLCQELHKSINGLENAATYGYYEDDTVPLDIYISELKLDTTYLHVQLRNNPAAYFSGYSINLFKTVDEDICKIQENWLKALKRYSSAITQANEIYRYSFFNKQRKIVDTLCSNCTEK